MRQNLDSPGRPRLRVCQDRSRFAVLVTEILAGLAGGAVRPTGPAIGEGRKGRGDQYHPRTLLKTTPAIKCVRERLGTFAQPR